MDIQRLRNLTTGRLHTTMDHVYEDLEMITGIRGLMTPMLPRALVAVTPWLKKQIKDPRFWDDKYDTTHIGEFPLPDVDEESRREMIDIYMAQPSPFK